MLIELSLVVMGPFLFRKIWVYIFSMVAIESEPSAGMSSFLSGWCLPHFSMASAVALFPCSGLSVEDVMAPISLPLPSSVCSYIGVPVMGILSDGKASFTRMRFGCPRLYILATISCPR